MIPWARHSDATGERVWHVAGAAFLGGFGLIVGAYMSNSWSAMIILTLASIGTFVALLFGFCKKSRDGIEHLQHFPGLMNA
jgi:hypothetical protein